MLPVASSTPAPELQLPCVCLGGRAEPVALSLNLCPREPSANCPLALASGCTVPHPPPHPRRGRPGAAGGWPSPSAALSPPGPQHDRPALASRPLLGALLAPSTASCRAASTRTHSSQQKPPRLWQDQNNLLPFPVLEGFSAFEGKNKTTPKEREREKKRELQCLQPHRMWFF